MVEAQHFKQLKNVEANLPLNILGLKSIMVGENGIQDIQPKESKYHEKLPISIHILFHYYPHWLKFSPWQ